MVITNSNMCNSAERTGIKMIKKERVCIRNLIFNLFFAFVIVSLQAQHTAKIDSLDRPDNFHDKVAEFKMFPNSPDDIVFLGNSITAGTQWNELLDMDNAVNRGISGDITFGVLERLDEVTEGHPAKVFILIGVNDLSRNIPDEMILRNYGKIINRIRRESPSTGIYVQTLLPVNNTFNRFTGHYDKASNILTINSGLRKMTEQKHINLIDLYPHFLDEHGRLDSKYTNDGLHLTAEGYSMWAKLLRPYLHNN